MKIWQMLAAAVLACLAAGQAQAVHWVRYTVTGSGAAYYYEQRPTGFYYAEHNRDFVASFTVDVDPNDEPGAGYVSTGFSFETYAPVLTLLSAQGTPTSVGARGSDSTLYRFQDQLVLSASFNGVSPTGGFATSIYPSDAFGVLTYMSLYAGPYGGGEFGIEGTIRSISVQSVPTYERYAFTAVPETATWLLMIGGMGLIGIAIRRRSPARSVASQPWSEAIA